MTTRSLAICEDPIFVVGCPRSGTSALGHSLGRHRDTWIGPESDFFCDFISHLKAIHAAGTQRAAFHWLSHQEVDFPEFLSFMGAGINAMFSDRANHKRWIEQTPAYTMYLPEVAAMFPDSRFLHIVRDGRKVVVSMTHSGFPVRWATDFEHACETWVRFVRAGLKFVDENPGRAREVRIADLEARPDEVFPELLGFLELEPTEDVATFFREGRRINSSFQEGAPRPTWESWDAQQVETFQRICGPLQAELGMEPAMPKSETSGA